MFAGFLIALLLLTGGGTTLAAEAAVPGDTLYPLKTEINEKVVSALTFRAEKKADWAARRAERRLEEADKLAEKGQLDAERSAFLAEKLKEHVEKTSSLLEKLENKGNITAAARINARLKLMLLAHSDAIDDDEDENDDSTATSTEDIVDTATSTDDIADDEDDDDEDHKKFLNWGKIQKELRAQLASSTAWQEDLLEKFSTTTIREDFKMKAAAGVQKAAENKLAEVNRYYEKKKDSLSEEADALVQEKLALAAEADAAADQHMTDGNYAQAFLLYQKELRFLHEAKKAIHDGAEKAEHEDDDDDETSTSTQNIADDDDHDDEDEDDHDKDRRRGRDEEHRSEKSKHEDD